MKKYLVEYWLSAFLFVFGSGQIFAQQGFGTNEPSKASVVDMQSENRGLLIPRVALTSLTVFLPNTGEDSADATSTSKTNSMLVYNTVTSGAAPNNVTPGYYYWTSANQKWNRLFTEADVILTEPWYNQATNTPATSNTQNIYQLGKVAVGKTTVYTGAAFDVAGAVRGGINQLGTVGANSVAFGDSNTASGETASVSGGKSNIASGNQSVVSGGLENEATGVYTTISGGYDNISSGTASTVSGGYYNISSGTVSTVSGGYYNTASGLYSIVSGGINNTALGAASIVSGGANNTASGTASTVSGGEQNTAHSAYEWVGGIYSTNYTPPNTTAWNLTDRLFNIGRGTGVASRADAFTILKNGKVGIGFNNFENRTAFTELFQVNGSAQFTGLPAKQGNSTTDKLVVVAADGVLKTVKHAPRFFYMPPVIFDTSTTGTGLTRDLYQDYVHQFTGENPYNLAHGAPGYNPMSYNGGLVKSPSAPAEIPVYGRTELHYYITNYDKTVFSNLSINDNGVLTYNIIGTATDTSSMTIVFQVKD
jgi:hypothetical protein